MISISGGSANELFSAAVHRVLAEGRRVCPRGAETKEILGAPLMLTEPRRRLVSLAPVRLLNPAFAVAEAVWILSGSDDPWIFDYNTRLAQFADDGVLRGAYGPRMRHWGNRVDQLDRVRALLQEDPDTRRALIQLYDPARDTAPNRDIPCTLNFRFYLREGRLHMHTTMRSQDLWWGFCYDLFTFTVLHELMAHWIGAQVGEYHHHVDSLHLYADHFERAAVLPTDPPLSSTSPALAVDWQYFDTTLEQSRTGTPAAPPGWEAFGMVMQSYRHWKNGNHLRARQVGSQVPGELGACLERWYEHLTHKAQQRRNGVDSAPRGSRSVFGNA